MQISDRVTSKWWMLGDATEPKRMKALRPGREGCWGGSDRGLLGWPAMLTIFDLHAVLSPD